MSQIVASIGQGCARRTDAKDLAWTRIKNLSRETKPQS
eukprot:CAMPEP_0183586060 /NCGR_PEP_ID=MMETSP0371-20130417/156488_1 /TAXON_ID=268820 /ORGANISM="Peridinium aciculiferum, Strain PAER-2" /LENGTH=37 /DNA_ID= /DNA_START= /DNA_END= /DNA_ORIENTATION=